MFTTPRDLLYPDTTRSAYGTIQRLLQRLEEVLEEGERT